MAETLWVEHHVDYAGRAKSLAEGGWSPRKKLICFLICATVAWSLILTPLLFLG